MNFDAALLPSAKLQKIDLSKRKKVIIISGPTAVGKTELSVAIATTLGGEIISADSMQVYRGMDIGTAKISKEIRQEIPHHLIDVQDVQNPCNIVDFYSLASRAVIDILSRNKVPIVVGGTGFYLHSLIYGPPLGPPSIPSLRKSLEEEMEKFGIEFLFDKLGALDPEYAQTITQRDKQKIVRALEIISLTGQKVSAFRISPERMESFSLRYNFRCWFIYRPKSVLYTRIEERCHRMIADGFLQEIADLERQGLRENTTASQAIGYKQGLEYLQSRKTAEDLDLFVQSFIASSKRFVKKQFTWFKKEPLFRWINIEEISRTNLIELIIQDYEHSF